MGAAFSMESVAMVRGESATALTVNDGSYHLGGEKMQQQEVTSHLLLENCGPGYI